MIFDSAYLGLYKALHPVTFSFNLSTENLDRLLGKSKCQVMHKTSHLQRDIADIDVTLFKLFRNLIHRCIIHSSLSLP